MEHKGNSVKPSSVKLIIENKMLDSVDATAEETVKRKLVINPVAVWAKKNLEKLYKAKRLNDKEQKSEKSISDAAAYVNKVQSSEIIDLDMDNESDGGDFIMIPRPPVPTYTMEDNSEQHDSNVVIDITDEDNTTDEDDRNKESVSLEHEENDNDFLDLTSDENSLLTELQSMKPNIDNENNFNEDVYQQEITVDEIHQNKETTGHLNSTTPKTTSRQDMPTDYNGVDQPHRRELNSYESESDTTTSSDDSSTNDTVIMSDSSDSDVENPYIDTEIAFFAESPEPEHRLLTPLYNDSDNSTVHNDSRYYEHFVFVNPVICYMCGESGHNESQCPNVFTNNCNYCINQYYQTCFMCRVPGHSSDYCPLQWRIYDSNIEPNVELNFEINYNSHIFCPICGTFGH